MHQKRKYTFRLGERRKNKSILDSVRWRLNQKERRSGKDRRKNK